MRSIRRACTVLNIILFTFLFVACGPSPRQRAAATLDDVESYINERPDSALAVLRALDVDSLRGPGQRARAALLHQIALDKCYIDITSDSVLAPAFWYLKHGTADQKLKTWYYRSVLARNAKDIDKQMLCLVRGEKNIPKARDPLLAGRLYTAKRVIYLHVYDLNNAAVEAKNAADAFLAAGDRKRYYDALIGFANIDNLLHDDNESSALIDTLRNNWQDLTARQRNKVFGVELSSRLAQNLGESEIRDFVEAYLADVPFSQIDWVAVARAYLYVGDVERAEDALAQVNITNLSTDEEVAFLLVRSDICRSLGQEKEAWAIYGEYKSLSDKKMTYSLSSRVRFLSEEESLLTARKKRNRWISILAVLAVTLSGLVLTIRVKLQERQRANVQLQGQLDKTSKQITSLKLQVRAAEKEARRWKDVLQKELLPPEIKQLVSERVSALNRYSYALAAQGDNQLALRELETSLSHDQPEQFLRDLTLQFGFLHPKLTQTFQSNRLNDQEKTFCTLLAMGCKAKEISSLTGVSEQRCYNVFNIVRRKMGLKEEPRTLYTLLQRFITE